MFFFFAEDVGKVEVGWGGEDGVGAEDEDGVGGLGSGGEGDDLLVMRGPCLLVAWVLGVGVIVDGGVDGRIDCGDGGVDVRRLALAGDEDGFAGRDVVQECLEECRYVFGEG